MQDLRAMSTQVCHNAMNMDWQLIKQRAQSLGILVTQVAVRDFDRLDQVSFAFPT